MNGILKSGALKNMMKLRPTTVPGIAIGVMESMYVNLLLALNFWFFSIRYAPRNVMKVPRNADMSAMIMEFLNAVIPLPEEILPRS